VFVQPVCHVGEEEYGHDDAANGNVFSSAISSSENLRFCKSCALTKCVPCLLILINSSAIRVRFEVGKRCLMSQFQELCRISNCDHWLVSGWISWDLRCNWHPHLGVMEEIGLTIIVLWDFSHCKTEANFSSAETNHCVGPVWNMCSWLSPSWNWQCLRVVGKLHLDRSPRCQCVAHFVLCRESFGEAVCWACFLLQPLERARWEWVSCWHEDTMCQFEIDLMALK